MGQIAGLRVDRRFLSALNHPLRERILRYASESDTTISASQLARAWDLDVPFVSYHVRRLHSLRALSLVGRLPRRGAIEHRYAIQADVIPQLTELFRRQQRHRTTAADVGAALRRLRERHGTRPIQVARAVGLGVDEIVAIEEGRADPRLGTLIDLADCLDASLTDLV